MPNSELASVCLFVYSRFEETKQTINALQENFLAKESNLFIFSDGPKTDKIKEQVDKIRNYVKEIDGFKSIKLFESKTNKGLATSIISGVTKIINHYGKVIVLEDDLITSRNFLDYMNQALEFYDKKKKFFAISGYSYPLKYPSDYNFDAAIGFRSYSWGWATWSDRWNSVDWEVKDYHQFIKNNIAVKDFSNAGSDLPKMLERQMNGQIDSWMIRWVYNQFKKRQFDVFPRVSKVLNIGFGKMATHTKCSSLRYKTTLDTSTNKHFIFPDETNVNKCIISQFKEKFSFHRRAYYKLLDKLNLSNRVSKILELLKKN